MTQKVHSIYQNFKLISKDNGTILYINIQKVLYECLQISLLFLKVTKPRPNIYRFQK